MGVWVSNCILINRLHFPPNNCDWSIILVKDTNFPISTYLQTQNHLDFIRHLKAHQYKEIPSVLF